MKIYGKINHKTCVQCGGPATTKANDAPMCLRCAKQAIRRQEYAKRMGARG